MHNDIRELDKDDKYLKVGGGIENQLQERNSKWFIIYDILLKSKLNNTHIIMKSMLFLIFPFDRDSHNSLMYSSFKRRIYKFSNSI